MRCVIGFSAIIVFAIAASSVCAGDAVTVERIGSLLWAEPYEFAVSGNYAYCGFAFGVRVYDISDPNQPALVNQVFIDAYGAARHLVSEDNLLYLCTGAAFHVLDITLPTAPVVKSQLPLTSRIDDLAVRDGIAYICHHYDGLIIVDATTPESPVVIGGLDVGHYHEAIALSGNYVYLGESNLHGDNYNYLHVIDVQNPSAPALVTTFTEIGGEVKDILIDGSVAYVAADNAGLAIVDISDPNAPSIIGRYQDLGYVSSFVLKDATGYVGSSESSAHLIDLTDPTAPVKIMSYAFGTRLRDIQLIDDLIISTNGSIYPSFTITDVSLPHSPVRLARYELPAYFEALEVGSQYAYAAAMHGGLYTFDLASPASLEPVDHYYALGVRNICLHGDYLYATRSDILSVFSLADPAHPEWLADIQTPLYCWYGIATSGDYAAILAHDREVMIYDISVPEAPVYVSTYTTGVYSECVAIDGQYVYAGCQGEIQVVDISNPAMPVKVNIVDITGPQTLDIRLSGNRMYVTEDAKLLRVYDRTDPVNPILLGSAGRASDSRSVREINGHVVVSEHYLYIYDLYNPTLPVEIESYNATCNTAETEFFANMAVVATTDGIQLLTFTFADPVYGDANGDETIDVSDAVTLINHIFRSGAAPIPMANGDSNCDGSINVGDAVFIIAYVFLGGSPPGCP